MSFPFPPLWMRAEDGTRVDVSGIYWLGIAMLILAFAPLIYADVLLLTG